MSQQAQVDAVAPGQLKVQGELDFSTVLKVRRAGEQLIAVGPETIEVDFSGVHASGSAAVSLMMCWLRAACRDSKAIHFTGLPEPLQRVIAVSGLSEHLSFDHPCHCQ